MPPTPLQYVKLEQKSPTQFEMSQNRTNKIILFHTTQDKLKQNIFIHNLFGNIYKKILNFKTFLNYNFESTILNHCVIEGIFFVEINSTRIIHTNKRSNVPGIYYFPIK